MTYLDKLFSRQGKVVFVWDVSRLVVVGVVLLLPVPHVDADEDRATSKDRGLSPIARPITGRVSYQGCL